MRFINFQKITCILLFWQCNVLVCSESNSQNDDSWGHFVPNLPKANSFLETQIDKTLQNFHKLRRAKQGAQKNEFKNLKNEVEKTTIISDSTRNLIAQQKIQNQDYCQIVVDSVQSFMQR